MLEEMKIMRMAIRCNIQVKDYQLKGYSVVQEQEENGIRNRVYWRLLNPEDHVRSRRSSLILEQVLTSQAEPMQVEAAPRVFFHQSINLFKSPQPGQFRAQ